MTRGRQGDDKKGARQVSGMNKITTRLLRTPRFASWAKMPGACYQESGLRAIESLSCR